MKYIILRHRPTGVVNPVIFADHFSHYDMARGAPAGWNVVSSGFFHIDSEEGLVVEPDKESQSIKQAGKRFPLGSHQPHKQDEMLLSLRLGGSDVCFTRDNDEED